MDLIETAPRDPAHTAHLLRPARPSPNGGYGWVCTLCVLLVNAHTWGVNSAWAVILAHFLKNSTFPNTSQTEYALIGGLSISQAFLIGPGVTKIHSMAGTPATLLLGTVLEFGGLLAASYASKVWHLYLTQGVLFGFGMGFLYIPASSVLPGWFSTKRSFAIGLAASGAGIGGLVYNLVAGRTIERCGVGTTYKILAFCSLGANLFSSLLLRERKQSQPDGESGQGSDRERERERRALNLQDLKHIEILLLVFWALMTEFGYVALMYSLPDYASSIGLTAHQGSITGAILNLGLAVGRPLVGYGSDKLGRITVPTILTASCGLACLVLWVPAHSYAALLVFALLAGMLCGIFWNTVTPVVAEVVGLGRLPPVFALVCLIMVVPTTVAEIIALKLVSGNSYLGAQVYIACLFLAGSGGLLVLRSWKVYDVERKAADEREGLGRDETSRFPPFMEWMTLSKLFIKGMV